MRTRKQEPVKRPIHARHILAAHEERAYSTKLEQYADQQDRNINDLSIALDIVIEERDELTIERERLRSLLRELRVHLREGSIERLRIEAALKEGE